MTRLIEFIKNTAKSLEREYLSQKIEPKILGKRNSTEVIDTGDSSRPQSKYGPGEGDPDTAQ